MLVDPRVSEWMDIRFFTAGAKVLVTEFFKMNEDNILLFE